MEINGKKQWPIFPGHNSFQNGAEKSLKISIQVKKGSKFLKTMGFISFTDSEKLVYPYKPGVGWLDYSVGTKDLIIRMLTEDKIKKPYIFSLGFFDNTFPRSILSGTFDFKAHEFEILSPHLRSFNMVYVDLDFSSSKDDNMAIYAHSDEQKNGLFMISQEKPKDFSLQKLAFISTAEMVSFNITRGSQGGIMKWGELTGNKKVNIKDLEYNYGLFTDRDVSIGTYFMAIFNSALNTIDFVSLLTIIHASSSKERRKKLSDKELPKREKHLSITFQ